MFIRTKKGGYLDMKLYRPPAKSKLKSVQKKEVKAYLNIQPIKPSESSTLNYAKFSPSQQAKKENKGTSPLKNGNTDSETNRFALSSANRSG